MNKNVITKLAQAKKEIGKISKDLTNPFYKSKYFDINQLLEHVEPILQKYELVVLQPIQDNKVTTIIYDLEDMGTIESSISLPDIVDPQKLGSAISYFRRYTLVSLLALQAEDDDANKTVKKDSTGNQGITIDNLLRTANIPQSTSDKISLNYENYDYETAHKCIEYLKANQLPGIENQNPSQTDIKNHVNKIK
jgi:hypothetical protein